MLRFKERGAKIIFLICASVSILALVLITVFIFYRGTPAIFKIGLWNFISGKEWAPEADIYGILPMIVASILLTLLSVGAGSFIGILTAIFLAELAPKQVRKIMRPAINLLSGIPSVVFGLFGMTILIPFVRNIAWYGFGMDVPGNGLLAGAMVLTLMIVPTVIATTQDAMESVPKSWREASYALGGSKMHTIFSVVVPAAKSGIITGVVLGVGRAIGETMAVILVSGNRPTMPNSIFAPIRSMTNNIALEMGYATGLHQEALFSTGVVLFVFIMILNGVVRFVSSRKQRKG